jgi:hypothetical protein
MAFRPSVNSQIIIENQAYTFTPHPAAKGMPYGQTGRRATVYKITNSNKDEFALKVFTKAFRSSWNADGIQQLQGFANIQGLQVCNRSAITPDTQSNLITQFPELKYAILMPWVQGETWFDIIGSQRPIPVELSQEISLQTAGVLAEMEQKGLAHCDLSGPNILVDLDMLSSANQNSNHPVALVDIEEMFGPGLKKPEKLPAGTSGYAHKTASEGLWKETADRFAGAVLLIEMLTWHDKRVRRISYEDHYFAPNELQTNCDRYKLALQVMNEQGKTMAADLFARAWFSSTLTECPTFLDWHVALNGSTSPSTISHQVFNVDNWRPITTQHRTTSISLEQLNPMLLAAANEGRWQDVLTIAPQVLQISPADAKALTLQSRAQRLGQLDQAIQQTWQIATNSGIIEDWENCIQLITTAQYQATKVERYKTLIQEAKKERQTAVQAAAFEQLIKEKAWGDARDAQDALPQDHPQIAALIARLDMEIDHQKRVEEQIHRAQDALAEQSWSSVVKFSREGLVLDPNHVLLKSLLEKGQNEIELDQQINQTLSKVDAFVEEEEWEEAATEIRSAINLQPNRDTLATRLENILRWQNWGNLLANVRSSIKDKSASDLLTQISQIPSGFSDIDETRNLLIEIAIWRDDIQKARQGYELDQLESLFKKPPAKDINIQEHQQWFLEESELKNEFEQACNQYDKDTIKKTAKKLDLAHPLQEKAEEWISFHENTVQTLQTHQKEFDALTVLNILNKLPKNFPNYEKARLWAEKELSTQRAIQQAQLQCDISTVEKIVKALSPDHPSYTIIADWIEKEKERKNEIKKARQKHNLDKLAKLLQQAPQNAPEYKTDWEWLNQQKEFRNQIQDCMDTFSLDKAETLLKKLPEDHPRYIELKNWLKNEILQSDKLEAVKESFDFEEAEQISSELPASHPAIQSISTWLKANRTLKKQLADAQAAYDHEKALNLLVGVPKSFPGYKENHKWAIQNQKRQEKVSLALKNEDVSTIKIHIKTWPNDDPYLKKLQINLAAIEKKQHEIENLLKKANEQLAAKNWESAVLTSQKAITDFSPVPKSLREINDFAKGMSKKRTEAKGKLSSVDEAFRQKKWHQALELAAHASSIYPDELRFANASVDTRQKLVGFAKKAEKNRNWKDAKEIWSALKSAPSIAPKPPLSVKASSKVSSTIVANEVDKIVEASSEREQEIAEHDKNAIKAAKKIAKTQKPKNSLVANKAKEETDRTEKESKQVRLAIQAENYPEAAILIRQMLQKNDAHMKDAAETIINDLHSQALSAQADQEWKKAKVLWGFLKSIREENK